MESSHRVLWCFFDEKHTSLQIFQSYRDTWCIIYIFIEIFVSHTHDTLSVLFCPVHDSFLMTLNIFRFHVSRHITAFSAEFHRCSIVVELRCGSLCLSTLASALWGMWGRASLGDSVRLGISSPSLLNPMISRTDLSLLSFSITFQCENARGEGGDVMCLSIRACGGPFSPTTLLQRAGTIVQRASRSGRKAWHKEFKVPDLGSTTMIYSLCVSNLSQIPLQHTRTYPLRANSLWRNLFWTQDDVGRFWLWSIDHGVIVHGREISISGMSGWSHGRMLRLSQPLFGHFEHQSVPWGGRFYFPV